MSPDEVPGGAGPGAGDAPSGSSSSGGVATGSSEATPGSRERKREGNMLPGRERRRFGLERAVVRLVATLGIIGIGAALGAILAASKVQGWITGLVVAGVAVILAGLLWSSKQL